MDQQEKEKIIKALQDRFVNHGCPRCGNQSFSLFEGYVNHPLQEKLKNMVLGGPTIPAVVTVCTRCGFLSEHALGALGLLPTTDKNNNMSAK